MCTLLKDVLHISFSHAAVGNFARETVLFLPMDACPIKLSLFRSLFKNVIDYIKDTISLSYEIGTVPVFTQTSLTYMYRERIVHHGDAYKSVNAQLFAEAAQATRLREKILNNITVLCVAKKGIQVTLTVGDEV